MLSSSLKTGSTDLRDTEVQQPNTAATLSLLINSRAFSANSGQFDAGSTTTGSSFLPSKPPLLFCSAMSISMTSFNVVSLIAMVPDSECKMPTLMVSAALTRTAGIAMAAMLAAPASQRRRVNGVVVQALFMDSPLCGEGKRADRASLGDAPQRLCQADVDPKSLLT